MNLVSFSKYPEDRLDDFGIPKGEIFLIKEFRKFDLGKLETILLDMFTKIHELNPDYNFTFTKEDVQPGYINKDNSFMDNYIITQRYKEFDNKIEVFVPKLIKDNFFILNNMVYVPLLFLEKAPIDRLNVDDDKPDKIFANINPVYNFTFDFDEKFIQFKNKKIDMLLFLKIFFNKDTEYLEFLAENKLIHKKTGDKPFRFTKEELKKVIDFFGFHKTEFFYEIFEKEGTITNFFDKFLMLEYYRDIFDNYYGVRTLPDIFKKIIDLYLNKVPIDMADPDNRRVVLLEYLIKPVFEIYVRLLYGAVDKANQNFLASMNKNSIMTKGFNKNLHRGNLYDLSLPYPSSLIHKISQDISIITDGRLPKSWTENHPKTFGKICPISVSADKTALNLVLTSTTQINLFGKLL
jgi:hypothetical protein